MATKFRVVDRGTDRRGTFWEIGVRGADVIVTSGQLCLDTQGREQFQRAFMAAERAAETYDPARPF